MSPNVVGESEGMDGGTADGVVVCEWNDLSALEAAFETNPGQIAGVIMEPILANTNCIVPPESRVSALR